MCCVQVLGQGFGWAAWERRVLGQGEVPWRDGRGTRGCRPRHQRNRIHRGRGIGPHVCHSRRWQPQGADGWQTCVYIISRDPACLASFSFRVSVQQYRLRIPYWSTAARNALCPRHIHHYHFECKITEQRKRFFFFPILRRRYGRYLLFGPLIHPSPPPPIPSCPRPTRSLGALAHSSPPMYGRSVGVSTRWERLVLATRSTGVTARMKWATRCRRFLLGRVSLLPRTRELLLLPPLLPPLR